MKNEDENRVKTNVDNSANENGAHGRACVSLTADKSIQSDSQLDKYGSDKINGNIRGSVSDCVAACTKEVQKRCLKEKEKRQKNQDDYKKKIRKHKLTIVYRVLLVAAALGAALALVVVQAKRHIYTGYDTVSSVNRETSSDAIDVRLKNGILTYSKDGAHCTDAKGNVKWNQTYVIQDVKLATCGSVAAIGSYNGREIYVQNTCLLYTSPSPRDRG